MGFTVANTLGYLTLIIKENNGFQVSNEGVWKQCFVKFPNSRRKLQHRATGRQTVDNGDTFFSFLQSYDLKKKCGQCKKMNYLMHDHYTSEVK